MVKEELIQEIKAIEISDSRKEILSPLVDYLSEKLNSDESTHLNFICTHNSRRSQFAQFWSHYWAHQFGLPVDSYSGGTEVTACHPNTIQSLRSTDVQITSNDQKENPLYKIEFGDKVPNLSLYSKLHSNAIEGKDSFAALMCCAEAEKNCPFVPGTEVTIPLLYEDPKRADGTAEEEEIYNQTSLQIASELHYVFTKASA